MNTKTSKIINNQIKNILKKKNLKWKDNIDIYSQAEKGLLNEIDHTNSKLEDFKSETMDIMEKGYSKTILSSDSEIKNNEKSNIKKCKKSFENLNNLDKNNKNIDIYGCENFIEEKLFYLI